MTNKKTTITTTVEAFREAFEYSLVEKKATIPILTHVHVTGTVANSTDLDTTTITPFEGTVTGTPDFCVPRKHVLEILKGEKGPLTITILDDSNWVRFSFGGCEFKVPGMSPTNFPELPQPANKMLSIEKDVFKKTLDRTVFTIATEETRYTLNGLLFEMKDAKTMIVAGTDGHRLSIVEIEPTKAMPLKALVPRNALEWIRTRIDDDVFMGINKPLKKNDLGKHVTFKIGNRIVISTLMSGNFPTIESIIPRDNEIKAVIPSAKALLPLLARVSKSADERSGATRWTFDTDGLTISAESVEAGSAMAKLVCTVTGLDGHTVAIGFSGTYIQEFLKSVGETPVTFSIRDSQSAGLFVVDNLRHVIMPMRM